MGLQCDLGYHKRTEYCWTRADVKGSCPKVDERRILKEVVQYNSCGKGRLGHIIKRWLENIIDIMGKCQDRD